MWIKDMKRMIDKNNGQKTLRSFIFLIVISICFIILDSVINNYSGILGCIYGLCATIVICKAFSSKEDN